jgi:tRNA pseudouridine55 synthase
MTNQKITPEDFIAGTVLLLDKPLYWTSFDVVKKIKALLRHRLKIKKIKVGHAGTLDPLASGLLIICTGKKTKEIETYQNQEKEYTGTFFLGASTPSSDLETQPDEFFPTDHIDINLVQKAAEKFAGEIDQVPPLFSAKKIDGERAYFHARRGDDTVLKSNKIFIHQFEITRFELPEADFRIVCSKGTYIRAIARDFGKEIKSGAYLKALRRTKIGNFSADDAWSIDDLENFFTNIVINQPMSNKGNS